MEMSGLLRLVAPCGLVCYTCDAMKDGAVNEAAKRLSYVLDSFDNFLANAPGARPVSGKYNDFMEVLDYLGNVKCRGCREDHCMNSGCIVPECVRRKEIHFCYECSEFPCTGTGFPDQLREKWIKNNKNIKEKGLEKFFEEEKLKPHYAL